MIGVAAEIIVVSQSHAKPSIRCFSEAVHLAIIGEHDCVVVTAGDFDCFVIKAELYYPRNRHTLVFEAR